LRERGRLLQPLDAQLEEQLVLVGERVMLERILLPGRERHPVIRVVGEKLVPLVEALLVQQARFAQHEADELSFIHGAMNSRQARNWLRIETSLVPLQVNSAASSSAGSKLRCRLTHSCPCAAKPSCAER